MIQKWVSFVLGVLEGVSELDWGLVLQKVEIHCMGMFWGEKKNKINV